MSGDPSTRLFKYTLAVRITIFIHDIVHIRKAGGRIGSSEDIYIKKASNDKKAIHRESNLKAIKCTSSRRK